MALWLFVHSPSSLLRCAHMSVKLKLCANTRRIRRLESLECDATLTSFAAATKISCMRVLKGVERQIMGIKVKSRFYHKNIHKQLPTSAHTEQWNEIFNQPTDERQPSAVTLLQALCNFSIINFVKIKALFIEVSKMN